MDPLPTQDEKQRALSKGSATMSEIIAFAVRNSSRNFRRSFTPKNPHLKCETCGKIGHTSEICRAHLQCDYCGWKGHTIDQCSKLQRTNSIGGKYNHQERNDQREHKNSLSQVNGANANIAAAPITSFSLDNRIVPKPHDYP